MLFNELQCDMSQMDSNCAPTMYYCGPDDPSCNPEDPDIETVCDPDVSEYTNNDDDE